MAAQFANPRNIPAGRRRHSRLHLCLPARLVTLTGTIPATLLDLSLSGARLRIDRRLVPGADAVLMWETYEAFGRIAWSEEDHCGIQFERQIAPKVLLSTRDISDATVPYDARAAAARAWAMGVTSR